LKYALALLHYQTNNNNNDVFWH